MTNPYTTQTISNYNASPPPDDGTEVAANQVNWSKHKDKLTDPIKTLAEGINTQLVAAFGKLPWYATRAISANDTQVAADERKLIKATNTITYTLLPSATATDGFTVGVINDGAGVITIDGDGSELIGDSTSITLRRPNEAVLLRADATGWDVVLDTRQPFANGADVASATTLTLGDGTNFDVTGTTTITSIASKGVGTVVVLQFDGILTLTHHATDLILPGGANITTAAGDIAICWEYASGDWRVVYQKANGTTVVPASLVRTTIFTASGTWTDQGDISSVEVELRGGGGGGGGCEAVAGIGGGGGQGGRSVKRITAATLGATETVTVGTGGTAGVGLGGGTGGTGNTTSFGAHCSATGGIGGFGGTAASGTGISRGGAGGAGSGGDIDFTGAPGGFGVNDSVSNLEASGMGGGEGGAASVNGSAAGNNGVDGGGGSGASAISSTARSGGVGGAGWVIVREYG